jgi:hypothetical protein
MEHKEYFLRIMASKEDWSERKEEKDGKQPIFPIENR